MYNKKFIRGIVLHSHRDRGAPQLESREASSVVQSKSGWLSTRVANRGLAGPQNLARDVQGEQGKDIPLAGGGRRKWREGDGGRREMERVGALIPFPLFPYIYYFEIFYKEDLTILLHLFTYLATYLDQYGLVEVCFFSLGYNLILLFILLLQLFQQWLLGTL